MNFILNLNQGNCQPLCELEKDSQWVDLLAFAFKNMYR